MRPTSNASKPSGHLKVAAVVDTPTIHFDAVDGRSHKRPCAVQSPTRLLSSWMPSEKSLRSEWLSLRH